jgi:hypothetical protein
MRRAEMRPVIGAVNSQIVGNAELMHDRTKTIS